MAYDPLSIAGCQAWYDFADPTTITQSSNKVSQANDKSGNGRNLTQATGANQPTWGKAYLNGKRYLLFAANHFMVSSAITLAQPITIIVLVLDSAAGASQANIVARDSVQFLYRRSTGAWAFYADSAEQGTTATDGNLHRLSAVFNGASSVLYLDNASITSANPGSGGFSTQAISVGGLSGGTALWQGDIGEILIYNTALSASDRYNIDQYLLLKWYANARFQPNDLRPHPFSPGLAR